MNAWFEMVSSVTAMDRPNISENEPDATAALTASAILAWQ